MRIFVQLLATVAGIWCFWLIVASPPLDVETSINGVDQAFRVDCDGPLSRTQGASLSAGTLGRSWTVAEADEDIYSAIVNGDQVDNDGIDDGAIDIACSGRRERRLAYAVLAALSVAVLLRAALVFPPRGAPVPDRSDA